MKEFIDNLLFIISRICNNCLEKRNPSPIFKVVGLDKYEDAKPMLFKIVCEDEYTKDQFIKASKYIHDVGMMNLDSDYHMVNLLMHLHYKPEEHKLLVVSK